MLTVRPMKLRLSIAATLALIVTGPISAAEDNDPVARLGVQDVRLARIAERMLTANDALCRQHMPAAGIVIHTRDQYPADPGDAFANGTVAVAQVVPESPAGGIVQPRDGLVAIGGTRTDTIKAEGEAPRRDAVFDVLAGQPPSGPLVLTIARGGVEQAVTIAPRPACHALVEIRAVQGRNARSDGRVIQVDYGLAANASDEELASVFAHEFAHLVLEHRRRLSAAGVAKGFFGEFGKNQRLNRQVEVEADRMSVHLLANAGYDPHAASALWRSRLGRSVGGLSAVYPSAEARAELLDREISEYLPGGTGPSWPGHLLARRDRPFD